MPELVRSYSTEWEVELDEAIDCPDCGGRLQRREWRTVDDEPLGSQYRCLPCRLDFWSDD